MALWSTFFPQSTSMPQPARISLFFFFLLAGTFLLTLVPHVVELPVWISVSVVIALVVRSVMEVRRLPMPSTTFCSLVALCLLCGVLLQFHTVFGRDAGMAFTAGLLAIKFFELRGPRDIALIIFSGYFVVMASLLFSQVAELFIYCLIMMWVLTALLRRLQIGDLPEDRLLSMLRWSGVIFLQALPLTVVLFFFFPRYPYKLQLSMGESALGFTNTVKPGDIASLSQNSDEAMYVSFPNGDAPITGLMYWRGLVLWNYDNKTGAWTAGDMGEMPAPENRQPTPVTGSDKIQQKITIFPHFQRWLFALDLPIKPAVAESEPQPWSIVANGDVLQLYEDSPRNKSKVDHRERYTVFSSFKVEDQTLTGSEINAATQPPFGDPGSLDRFDEDIQTLADDMHKDSPKEEDYIRTVLRFFRLQHFIYTATPGARFSDGRWLHDFLFTTRAGFCEHYAAAFAVLMRLEHIPARVVVGYCGATYNPYKNIYTVYQSNAHAWDEVWIDAPGQLPPGKAGNLGHWQRIDPTSYLPPGDAPLSSVPPSPQNSSGDELFAQASQHQPTFSETYLPPWASRSLNEFQLRREQIEADWDDLVFSYDPAAQDRLADMLGFGRNRMFLMSLTCLGAMGLGVAAFLLWIRRKPPLSPVESIYGAFCRTMAQRGIPRAMWEGPLAYTGRVAEAFPEKDRVIRGIGSIVAQSRYGAEPPGADSQAELKSLLLLITGTASSPS
jgi:transglutaminase-like putative cysteine protease